MDQHVVAPGERIEPVQSAARAVKRCYELEAKTAPTRKKMRHLRGMFEGLTAAFQMFAESGAKEIKTKKTQRYYLDTRKLKLRELGIELRVKELDAEEFKLTAKLPFDLDLGLDENDPNNKAQGNRERIASIARKEEISASFSKGERIHLDWLIPNLPESLAEKLREKVLGETILPYLSNRIKRQEVEVDLAQNNPDETRTETDKTIPVEIAYDEYVVATRYKKFRKCAQMEIELVTGKKGDIPSRSPLFTYMGLLQGIQAFDCASWTSTAKSDPGFALLQQRLKQAKEIKPLKNRHIPRWLRQACPKP